MANATMITPTDATTPSRCTHCGRICACQRLADAGWRVNCSACGRTEYSAAEWASGVRGLAITDGIPAGAVDDDVDLPYADVNPATGSPWAKYDDAYEARTGR